MSWIDDIFSHFPPWRRRAPLSRPRYVRAIKRKHLNMTTATLNWAAVTTHTDGSAIATGEVAGYDIFMNGGTTPINTTTVTGTTFTTLDLPPGTYTFTVQALDANGSAQNSAQSAPTAAIIVPPVAVPLAAPTDVVAVLNS